MGGSGSEGTLDNRPASGKEPPVSRVGGGNLGGKVRGLRAIQRSILPGLDHDDFEGISIEVPRYTVVATDVFTEFVDRNRLSTVTASELSDPQIAQAFQRGHLPERAAEELRDLLATLRIPLVLRPSCRLEETLDRCFPGIFTAKMIANSEADERTRFRNFVAALKLVWASTYFGAAVMSRRAAGQAADAEQMAVVVQEVLGTAHGPRFYPTLSAVARTYNHYPAPGDRPADGIVTIALGLGRTIDTGAHIWGYSPQRRTAPPPFKGPDDLLKHTQKGFWAVNLDGSQRPDPTGDTEFLVRAGLREAESDGELRYLASTYDAGSDRLRSGLGASGPRALTFAPLLRSRTIPFARVVERLLELSREVVGGDAEIEVAAQLDRKRGVPMRLGLLQLRPMMGTGERHSIEADELEAPGVVAASDSCLGNGRRDDLTDVVYLRPRTFDRGLTHTMASELEAINRGLVDEGRHGIFVGFGRWGTSDPRFGLPVVWRQISAARVIVEVAIPGAPVSVGQGTHLYHRVLAFQVLYLRMEHDGPFRVDYDWLDAQPEVYESRHVRQVRLEQPLDVRVDGVTRRGVVRRMAGS